MKRVKFAIIGLGRIGRRHADIIMKNPECELVAVCDVLPVPHENSLGEKLDYYESLDNLLNSNIAFDVLSITTPNGLHEEHAIKALRAGKHVLIEKPLALSKTACEQIINESGRQQKQVFCVMQNRFSPLSVWLKQVLENKVLGKIYMVQINCFWNRDERYYKRGGWHGSAHLDGGTLFTQFSHFIDMMFWLFGDISNISGRFANFNHERLIEFEDSGCIQFDFVEGGMGSFNYSTACFSKNLESSITVMAEKGSVKVGGQYMNKLEYCQAKDYELPAMLSDFGDNEGAQRNHQLMYDNVVNVLSGRANKAIEAIEAQKIVEIIERIYDLKKNEG